MFTKQKVSTWLKGYGFRPLGDSGTFLIFDRRDADDVSIQGIILLNLYSDDGLTSIDNSKLWDRFMLDFKSVFEVVEKDPDYFLGCATNEENLRIVQNILKYALGSRDEG
jgi:hypothetical protein